MDGIVIGESGEDVRHHADIEMRRGVGALDHGPGWIVTEHSNQHGHYGTRPHVPVCRGDRWPNVGWCRDQRALEVLDRPIPTDVTESKEPLQLRDPWSIVSSWRTAARNPASSR